MEEPTGTYWEVVWNSDITTTTWDNVPAGGGSVDGHGLLGLALVLDGQEARRQDHLLLQVGVLGALLPAAETPATLGHPAAGAAPPPSLTTQGPARCRRPARNAGVPF